MLFCENGRQLRKFYFERSPRLQVKLRHLVVGGGENLWNN